MMLQRKTKEDVLKEALKYVDGMDITNEEKVKLCMYLSILSNPFYVPDVLSIPEKGDDW